MIVKIEYVKWLKDELRKINSVPLNTITWIEDEKVVGVDAQVVEDFDLSGLSNVDFIMTGEYKRKP